MSHDQLNLDAIEAREAAATPGPWGHYNDGTGLIDIAADLHDTGHGYRCRRYIGQLEANQIDNDPTHHDWSDEQDRAQSAADAEFIAHARTDVRAMAAEIRRLRARVREYGELAARRESELIALRARAADLKRPAIEGKRNEIRQSFTDLIAAAEETKDYEGAFDVQCRLREREEQWAREDAANQPAAVEAHVVADDSDNPDRCGARHHQHPDTACTEPPGHYVPATDPHAGPLVIDGRECGRAAWDEPAAVSATRP